MNNRPTAVITNWYKADTPIFLFEERSSADQFLREHHFPDAELITLPLEIHTSCVFTNGTFLVTSWEDSGVRIRGVFDSLYDVYTYVAANITEATLHTTAAHWPAYQASKIALLAA